jgi:hypothetical protein
MENESITLQDIINKIKSPLEEVNKIFTFYYAPKYFKLIRKAYIQINGLYFRQIQNNINNLANRLNFVNVQRVFLYTGMLIDGYNLTKKKMNLEMVIYLLLSALFYDTGSIEEKNENSIDNDNRINRSIQFIKNHIEDFQIGEEDADIIGRLIRFTGNMSDDVFFSMNDDEKITGSILGTAYFIERLTDKHYLKNFMQLYDEFANPVSEEFKNEINNVKAVEFSENLRVKLVDYARFHFKHRYQIDRDLFTENIDENILTIKRLLDNNDINDLGLQKLT